MLVLLFWETYRFIAGLVNGNIVNLHVSIYKLSIIFKYVQHFTYKFEIKNVILWRVGWNIHFLGLFWTNHDPTKELKNNSKSFLTYLLKTVFCKIDSIFDKAIRSNLNLVFRDLTRLGSYSKTSLFLYRFVFLFKEF